jgi:asparagine synthase (glutamine-hydrolysing)
MRNDRFLAGFGLPEADRTRLLAGAIETGLTVVFETAETVVACTDPTAVLTLGDEGVIIGPVFQSGDRQRLATLTDDARRAIVKSGGTRLFEAFWGGYVGIVRTKTGASVVRAPFGRLPCLFKRRSAGAIAASDIDLTRAASGDPFSLDFDEITRQLVLGDVRLATTSLYGIEELRGGSRLLDAVKHRGAPGRLPAARGGGWAAS